MIEIVDIEIDLFQLMGRRRAWVAYNSTYYLKRHDKLRDLAGRF